MVALSPANAAARVLAAPAPVVLLDACAIVDLVRMALPKRKIPAGVGDSARRLVSAARASPTRAWLVLTETVRSEVAEHTPRMLAEARSEAMRLDEEVLKTLDVLDLFFPGPRPMWNLQSALLQKLPRELELLVGEVVTASLLLSDDAESIELARIRALLKYPPAHVPGKESRKDCEMYEHYRAFVRVLRRSEPALKVVFATSNTADFDHSQPHLEDELRERGIKLVPSLTDAWGYIGRL
jgi:hypothetical protein